MNTDQVLSWARTIFKVAGGFVVAKGFTDGANWEIISGGAVALVGAIWSHFHHTEAK